jgi:S-adenosylmethionine decarboxylase
MKKDIDQNYLRPYFKHFVLEIETSFENANSLNWIQQKVNIFIKLLGIETLKCVYHLFKPQGISLIYIISSSHLAVHTWPENNYIHIELLTCSKNTKIEKFDFVIKKVFPDSKYKLQELNY